MKEFLTIGELANIFNMDVQLLRHYDTKGLLVPQVRNSENNRRFYHFDQVYPLATIRYLRRLDYSLAQIKAFLHSNGLRDNLQMLSQQAQQLRRQCDELNATIQIIQQKVEFIEREQAASQRDKFYVRSFPRRAFLHIGEEINLFTHELFYFYPTVGFYQGQRKWFGAYLYEDTPAEARRLLGPDKIIGVSAHNVAEAKKAFTDGADYLGCGAMFPTHTKTDTNVISRQVLADVCASVPIPVVAIGGIHRENLLQLAGCGEAGIAVISAIFAQPDIEAACRELREMVRKL